MRKTKSLVQPKKYVVLGGCGFLGRRIVELLVERGEQNVYAFDINKSFDDSRVHFIVGDITKMEDLEKAFSGADVVIHTASPMATAGHEGLLVSQKDASNLFHRVNIVGTELVIEQCVRQKVKKLVYTSSSSVVWCGQHIVNGNEDLPYCKNHLDYYSHTKEVAERKVLEANGREGLLTCVIRPTGLYGPRDRQCLVGFYQVAKTGNSKWIIIGDGKNRFDWCYVDNAAHAHILAADRMTEGSAVCGQVYFATDDESIPFWDFAKYFWSGMGFATPRLCIPYLVMYWLAVLLAMIVKILSPFITIRPAFTPLRVCASATNRTFNIDKAKRELGYKPIVPLAEALRRSLEWLKTEEKAGSLPTK